MAEQTHKLTEDEKVLHEMGYAQELSRRMGAFQNFAISFAIICIVAGGITSFPVALSAGGGASVGIVWPLGSLFALLVAAAMGQIASSYPTAGGIYHWSSIFGGKGFGWAAAWFNLLGLIFVVSSVNMGVFLLFRDLFLAQVVGMDVASWTTSGEFSQGWWTQTLFIAAITALQALINHRFLKLTTVLTDLSGYIIMTTAIILTLAMLIYAPSHDISRLFTFHNYTGDAGGGVWPAATAGLYVFLLGFLHVVYTITGFDASAHTSEETRDAQKEVPRGMIRSVFWSFLFGYIMVCSFVLALPDGVDKDGNAIDGISNGAAQGWNAFNWLIAQTPMPSLLRSLIIIGIVVSNFLCALAGITSTSRMMYAFARDGGLPASKMLASVDHKLRTPGAAIWVGALLSIVAVLYGDAFLILSTGCAVFLYLSYVMPVAAAMRAEMAGKWKNKGPFNLAGASIPVGALAILGCGVLIFAGVQPPQEKVLYLIIAMVVVMVIVWFAGVRNSFQGPPVGDEIKKRQAAIAEAEKAMET